MLFVHGSASLSVASSTGCKLQGGISYLLYRLLKHCREGSHTCQLVYLYYCICGSASYYVVSSAKSKKQGGISYLLYGLLKQCREGSHTCQLVNLYYCICGSVSCYLASSAESKKQGGISYPLLKCTCTQATLANFMVLSEPPRTDEQTLFEANVSLLKRFSPP